jgi:hypothetical protein
MEILIILMMFMALLLIVIWLPYFKQVKDEALNIASTIKRAVEKKLTYLYIKNIKQK